MDLNISPYYDDFEEAKNFLRILFIPRRAVQARELTQLQSLLQNQTSRFANHIFKDGTSILGGRVKVDFNKPFLEVADTTNFLAGQELQKNGDVTVRGLITSIDAANNLLYYDVVTGEFAATDLAEVVSAPSINQTVIVAEDSTVASIEPGVVFVGGSFVVVESQEIIIEAEGNTGNFVIGYTFDEDIVTHETDQTLLDPANGSFNFLAPGAARYRGQATLVSYVEGSTYPDNFYQVTLIRNGNVITTQDKVQYADLLDLLARRTYDESGNYSIKEFPIILEEHDTDPAKIKVGLEPGKAYVLGYEQETIATTEIETDKAREVELIQNSSIYADFGPYIEIADDGLGNPDVNGVFNITTKQVVTLYSDVGATNILGTARITSLIKGTNNRHRIYLSEVSGITNLLASVKSISDGLVTAITNIDSVTGLTVVGNRANNVPVFPLSLENVKTFADVNYSFVRSFSGISVGGGIASLIGPDDISDFSNNPGDVILVVDTVTNTVLTPGGAVALASSSGTPSTLDITGLATINPVDVIVVMSKRVGTNKIKTVTPFVETIVSDGAGLIDLTKVDIISITSIIEDPTGAATDVTANGTLDNGQQDYYYNKGFITGLNPAVDHEITYSYFQHSGAGDYFSVDSYDISLYDSIPDYTSKDGASVFNLRDSIDFRRSVDDLSGGTSLIYPGDDITLDYEYYLGRIDKVYLDQYGAFGVAKGVSSRYPEEPNDIDNSMTLYILTLPPYTFSTEDIEVELIENKNYTMRDIGSLEKRIENLEYYSALNLLEKATADLAVSDVYGLEKFKNGIVVDDFSGHGVGDVYDEEYDCAIDPEEGILRTPFSIDSINFEVTDDTPTLLAKNMKVHEHIATLNYSEGVFIDQSLSSEAINVNPYNVFLWVGHMGLTPPSDNWVDVQRRPAVVTNIRGANDNMKILAQRTGFLGTRWNSWNTIWSGRRRTRGRGWLGRWGRTITTDIQRRVGRNIRIVPGTIKRSLGDRIVDSSIIPFMREKDIAFEAHGMRPNTTFLAFFDGVDVTDQCVPPVIVSDDAGHVTGTFTIPNPNTDPRKFRTGSKTFRLADAATDPKSSAESEFTASGLLQTKQNTIVSVENPRLVQSNVTETRVRTRTRRRRRRRWFDPIAESFIVEQDGGIFVSSIEVFFKTKSQTLPVTMSIVENDNGYPSQNILPFSEKTLDAVAINTSTDGSVETKFTFTDPVYLQDGVEYSFMLTSNSDEYEAFVAEIGGVDLISGAVIAKQPFAGVMFKSQNASTWTADQTRDIKFKINRCVFDTGSIGSFDINSGTVPENVLASTTMFNIDTLILNDTDIGFQFRFGTDTLIDFPNKTNIDLPAVKSIDAIPGSVLEVTATLASDNDSLSPVVNINRMSSVMILNTIKDVDDAGTYLTRTINLENPSDDLKVLFDAQLPGASEVEVYFKTTEAFTSRYVTVGAGQADDDMVGRIQYVYNDVGLTINLEPDSTVSVTKNLIDDAYLKDITNYDIMVAGKILVQWPDDIVPAMGPSGVIDVFPNATPYAIGDYVYSSTTGKVYKAIVAGSTDPAVNPENYNYITSATLASGINNQAESSWRPMKLEATPNPTLDTGNEFIEYTYIPEAVVDEEFSSFAVKIQLVSVSPVNTPFVKAFRALAVY